jgi:hypothetical protein
LGAVVRPSIAQRAWFVASPREREVPVEAGSLVIKRVHETSDSISP